MFVYRLTAVTLIVLLLVLPVPVSSQDAGRSVLVGVLKHFPPHYLTDEETGEPTGFAIDVMDAVADRAGLSIDYVVYETWPELITAMQDGDVDIIANQGITEERKAYVDFTMPVETTPINLFIRRGTGDITGVEDLSGRRVSVVRTNIGERLIQGYETAFPVVHESPEQALLALLSGQSDALIYPGNVLLGLARESGLEDRIEVVGEPLHEVKRAIGVRKGQPELFQRLDTAVAGFVDTPDYRDIFAKWHGAPDSLWSAQRVGILMGALLLIAVAILGTWHYISIVRLNRGLAATVTQARKAEDELYLRNRAIEASESGILITAPQLAENPIVYANPAIERMTGYSAEEMLGRNPRFLHGDDFDQPELDEIRAAIRNEQSVHVSLRNYRKDGTCFLADVHITPVRDENGKVAHFVGIQNDITDRVAIEEQLRQAQKMEAIGQLTGGVAHDFNNLLTVVIGNLERLEARLGDSDRCRSFINQAQEAAELGGELTSRLLAFSRLQPLSPQAIDLNGVILDLSDLLKRTLGETVQISTLLDSDLRKTFADRAQVQNALLNLAINGKDAMPNGGRLTIETCNVEIDEEYAAHYADAKPGQYVMMSVTDAGIGMPKEVQEHAFEPFYTTKEVGSGSGLGLSMVYGFAKQSGGHVRLYSEPGHGTTVSLYLPQIRGASEEPTHPAINEPRAQGETVLVVEDDPRVRRVTVDRFMDLGYKVLEADSGLAALHVLERSGRVQLLFTDIVMSSDMNGRELGQRVQSLYPDIRVLFTSGYADAASEGGEPAANNTVWLPKPYKRVDLARAVRDVLDAENQPT